MPISLMRIQVDNHYLRFRMFFMHLKFDSRVFTGLFLSGLVLATFMTVALIVLFQVLPQYNF